MGIEINIKIGFIEIISNIMKLKNIINSFVIFIVFVCTFVFGVKFVRAVPAPEQLVINEQTQQCGVYWSGDEFSQYKLPVGWTIYEPTQNLFLKTPYGTCSNFDFRDQGACCGQLGLTNVGRIGEKLFITDNNTTSSVTIKNRVIAISVLFVIAVVFGLVVLKKYRNKKI